MPTRLRLRAPFRNIAAKPLLAALFIACGGTMRAQSSDPAPYYWGDAGVGGGSYFGMIGGAAVNTRGPHLLSIRGAYMEEFRLCIFGPCATPTRYHAELAGMYGRIARGKWWSLSASVGGAITFIRTDEPEPTAYTTIGVPVELQAIVIPFPFLGVGITTTANVNPRETFAGAFLSLHVGKLR